MAESKKMSEENRDEPTLTEETDVVAEPLSAVEKKLILFSVGIGAALLIILVLATGAYKF